jgi:hypothetical protein
VYLSLGKEILDGRGALVAGGVGKRSEGWGCNCPFSLLGSQCDWIAVVMTEGCCFREQVAPQAAASQHCQDVGRTS